MLLKRKKTFEAEVQKLYAMVSNIENMKNAMMSNTLNADYFRTVASATSVLDRQQQTMNPELVDDLRDKYEEAMDKQKEMDDILGQQWGPQGTDDADLESELAELEAGALEAELTAPPRGVAAGPASAPIPAQTTTTTAAVPAPAPVAPLPSFPGAPTNAPVVPAAAQQHAPARSMEDELAALEASLA